MEVCLDERKSQRLAARLWEEPPTLLRPFSFGVSLLFYEARPVDSPGVLASHERSHDRRRLRGGAPPNDRRSTCPPWHLQSPSSGRNGGRPAARVCAQGRAK